MTDDPLVAVGPRRLHGLDTLRAVAITLVFAYHYRVFVSGENTFGWFSAIGWTGVDLFFVLSGYLISKPLIAALYRGERFSLQRFFSRRWLRTLPAFWVVLALYFCFPAAMGGKPPPPLWRFLTFTQNWGLTPGTAFSHAWSLCIEEQFYIVLPLLLLALARLSARTAALWMLIGGGIAIGITLRAVLWFDYVKDPGNTTDYYVRIYYATLTRWDEFLPGVAVALIRHAHPTLWQRLMARGGNVLVVAAVATLAMLTLLFHFYFVEGSGYGFWMTSFGYSLLAVCFAGLVLAALSPQSVLHRWRVPGAASLAMWSYSLYLIHKPLFFIARQQLAALALPAPLTVLLICAIAVSGGWLLHRLVERPFMQLRERWSVAR